MMALHSQESRPVPLTQEAILAGVVGGERWAHAALYDQLYPVVTRALEKILRDSSGDYED